jgi:hypothetical protein
VVYRTLLALTVTLTITIGLTPRSRSRSRSRSPGDISRATRSSLIRILPKFVHSPYPAPCYRARPMSVSQRADWYGEPQQLSPAWTLHKGAKTARCAVWSHQFGWALRLMAGADLIQSHVCRSQMERHRDSGAVESRDAREGVAGASCGLTISPPTRGSASSTLINRGRIRTPTNQTASVPGQGCCGAHKARGTRRIGVASSAKAALAIATLADSYRTTVTSWYKRLRTSARPRGRRRLPSVSAPSAYRW